MLISLILWQARSGAQVWEATFGLVGLIVGIYCAVQRKRKIWPTRDTVSGKALAVLEIAAIVIVYWFVVSIVLSLLFAQVLLVP